MTAVVFLGPTLPHGEARERLDAVYLPPVAQGDVWRALAAWRPRAIGIVDGAFRHVPAVWHKEILWALSRGAHVLGAASMGALRAAELHAFGMRGVGAVFEAYRDGVLACTGDAPFEDDDEVAILHAPAEAAWQPLSEALVDMRCTLLAAEHAGAITPAERRLVAATAKAVFFAERTWRTVLDRAVTAGLAPGRRTGLEGWLERGRFSQKRLDALSMLDAMAELLAKPPAPFVPSFRFAETAAWRAAIAEAGAGAAAAEGPLAVLDELRLDPAAWRATLRAALLDELARAQDGQPGRREVRQALAALRTDLGLADRAALDAWAEAADGDAGTLERIAEGEAAIARLGQERMPWLAERMLDRLRADGRYAALRRRAEAKAAQRRRSTAVLPDTASADDVRVLHWYFTRRLSIDVPGDLEAFARDLGFADADGLCRALQIEYRFVLAGEGADGSDDATP